MLHNWVKKFKKNGYNIIDNKRGRKPKTMKKIKIKKEPVIKDDKLKQLEKQIIYLKAENEYLKKLNALVQERELKQMKK